MATISLCMIVKNEESVLARCLKNVQDAVDEIIIVDTGSEDRTKEIAGQFTSRIYDFPWCNDFSAARNYSLSHAEMDYCFWLDADDVLTPENQLRLIELKKKLTPSIDLVMLKYEMGFDQAGIPSCSFYRERIWKNHAGYRFSGRVHEAVPPVGRVLYGDVVIEHRKEATIYTDRNLKIYEEMRREKETFSPRDLFYYARELYYFRRYAEAIEIFLHFLDRPDGWVENKIEACRILAECYRAVGKEEERAEALLKSFSYDIPRGEICCDLGQYFIDHRNYETAAWWYRQALQSQLCTQKGGFSAPECYREIPLRQLKLCQEKLENRPQVTCLKNTNPSFEHILKRER
ncbi:glycosyltransferase family 2 protein [Cuneatibacter sp. NSJ-177]|uniref:glycosyltransferase family 2 protein n=1 Tax=Cuneatibacter sp. NSJ-177 TaxID=2931401 RepID=UPI001FD56222|nr:glycosyltransferase family 2 protein [Cuneatibacter sp. NSJ-177]MCJ7835877.1 glycosyltransferase family 2 protein [Cuneatibacter sp. NSJ-177]